MPFKPLRAIRDAIGSPQGLGGIVGGALLGGPAGAALVGLLGGRVHRNELDKFADEQQQSGELDRSVSEELMNAAAFAKTDIDREQLAHIADRQEKLRIASEHHDPQVRQAAAQAMVELSGNVDSWLGNIEQNARADDAEQRARQAANVMDSAKTMRSEVDREKKGQRELQSQGDEMNRLLNTLSEEDINKPIIRARLVTLAQGGRMSLADTADIGDALGRVGGGGILPMALALFGGMLKAEDFKFSKNDWRAIGASMYDVNQRIHKGVVDRAGREADLLDKVAGKLGNLPEGYTYRDYVMGDTEEFPRPFSDAKYPDAAPKGDGGADIHVPTSVDDAKKQAGDLGQRALEFMDGKGESQAGATVPIERTPGNAVPDELKEFFARLQKLPVGAQLRGNPDDGRIFADLPNGQTVEVETHGAAGGALKFGGERRHIKQALRDKRAARERQTSVKGVIDRSGNAQSQ